MDITPTTFDDELNSDGDCSLREAIEAANTNTAVDACPAGSAVQTDTIRLDIGTYTLSVSGQGEDANQKGDLDVLDTAGLEIIGIDARSTILDAAQVDRHFDLRQGSLIVRSMTLQNGFINYSRFETGAGIRVDCTDCGLIFQDSRLTGGDARYGGGISTSFSVDDTTHVTIERSLIDNNQCQSFGAVAMQTGGNLRIVNSTISNNHSYSIAGAITLDLSNQGSAEIVFSTITNNSVQQTGSGGIFAYDGSPTYVVHSILAGNVGVLSSTDTTRDPQDIADCWVQNDSQFTTDSWNVFGSTYDGAVLSYGCVVGATDVLETSITNILDTTLANHGGQTDNHSLVAGSPAVDLAVSGQGYCGAIDSDQDSKSRLIGSACDAGAVEYGATCSAGVCALDYEASTTTVNHVVTRQNFSTTFANPIVLLGPPSYNGTQPTTARVTSVDNLGFDFHLDEWSYLDGIHFVESLGQGSFEQGAGTLGGLLAEAGSLSVDHNWAQITFTQSFPVAPVVLAQVASDNDTAPVATRIRNVTASGFEVRLQEEENADDTHALETVHFFAVEAGRGYGQDGTLYEAGTISNVGELFVNINFSDTYTNPVFFAAMQTYNGNDPAALRHQNLTATDVEIMVEEETSRDSEVGHPNREVVGFLVIGNQSVN
ncbi:MAG: choice-of-anchor Q domain-containing protein [Acidobacteriota bacterium]